MTEKLLRCPEAYDSNRRSAFDKLLLSTHADRQCGYIGYCLCFCVCLFVRLRISPARIKLAASNFARWFMGILGRYSPILEKICSPRSPKSDESATHPEVKFRVGRAPVIACLSISRGVWT